MTDVLQVPPAAADNTVEAPTGRPSRAPAVGPEMLPAGLKALREMVSPADRILSAFLDTSPGRIENRAYALIFRDNCKALRSTLPPDEREAFNRAAAQAEAYLDKQFAPRSPGLALFATGYADSFLVVSLPVRPVEGVTWAEAPVVEPLEEALDEFERTAVVLFDKERARIFTVYLGAIEERHVIEDAVPGKQRTGGWFALAQTRYARHHEDHVLRHAKRTIRALTRLARTRPFDRLILGGPSEALALLRRHLPRPLRTRLAGTVQLELFASDDRVLAEALRAAEAIERREELVMVEELFEAASAAHVALGVDDTLAAGNDGRVHGLFVADQFQGTGSECTSCGFLTAAAVTHCPVCGARAKPVADLRERVVERAAAQRARVEVVAGEAASRLLGRGGLAAWTRY
ncbi:MAG: host attachment protein [Chloroflexi bacterium]|nr:host attachment protein [Chloroflexota bacterium]